MGWELGGGGGGLAAVDEDRAYRDLVAFLAAGALLRFTMLGWLSAVTYLVVGQRV